MASALASSTSAATSSKLLFAGLLLLLAISQATSVLSADLDGQQVNSVLKEALRQYNARGLAGQLNMRSQRSDLRDALKIIQLQELENKYGTISRPRFGKRGGEITFDNVPTYGDLHPGLDILRRR